MEVNTANAAADNIYKQMSTYNPFGAKDGEYKEYQKIEFIRRNIEEVTEDGVDEYSVAVGKIYRWLMMTLELRIADVRERRAKKATMKQEREEAIERENDRKEKRDLEVQEKLEAAIAAQEEAEAKAAEAEASGEDEQPEEVPSFDQDAFSKQETDKYDEEYPPIEIPDEVVDDIDNDYNIEDEEVSEGQEKE